MAMARPMHAVTKESRSADRVEDLDTTHRINVNFTGEAYDTLAHLAKANGKSMSEVLRDAVTLEKWFDEARRDGGRVLLERNGEVREILWR